MKDADNLHQKILEMCDCYTETDPLKEMSAIVADGDQDQAAVKWLALAALHGINSNAEKITLVQDDDGKVRVSATYRKTDLPSPGDVVGREVIETLRQVTHIDADKGKTRLALGIRGSDLEVKVKVKDKKGQRKLSITFPET